MSCPAILTGDRFISRLLEHIDCQSRLLGSYGYEALGQPGSTTSLVMTGLLTLFIALFGLRLLFGPPPGARDVVFDVLKIGLVLTLAFSWPAFRTLVHDVALDGPAEIAAQMTAPTLTPSNAGMVARIQGVDGAMVRLTELGTGRTVGQYVESDDPGSRFGGTAIEDEGGFGYGRVIWLAGMIGSLALLRIAAGVLLALAPLAAALLLFEATRGIFAGWLRGLVLTLIGTIGVSVVVAVELAVLEPWLADALRIRTLGYAAPSAPTELLAMTLAFALVHFGMIWLMARVAWHRGWLTLPAIPAPESVRTSEGAATARVRVAGIAAPSRAERIADNVEMRLRYERHESSGIRTHFRVDSRSADAAPVPAGAAASGAERLGSSWRRPAGQRVSRAATGRDSRT